MGRACVLVIEDEPAIAFDVVLTLEDAGYAVVGPAETIPAALDELRARQPDAAILDLNLNGELSTPVAVALHAAGVPFVIVTASSPSLIEPEHRQAPVLFKPVPARALLSAVERLIERDS